jgi:hypothetical protein
MPRTAAFSTTDHRLLLRLQSQAMRYFMDNQTATGLILDRQRNHGPRHQHGLCSTAASGMGWIALALASADPYRLLTPAEATLRIGTGLETALHALPHDHGIVPHFIDSRSGAVHGSDHLSTIETAWLVAGALWASAFLRDTELERLAQSLWQRIDWRYWTAPDTSATPLLRHGQGRDGRFLDCAWDRLNGETVFMYVLASGAEGERALPAEAWQHLQLFYGSVAGLRFNSSDLGLFVFQYGLDLLDLSSWLAPCGVDLVAEATIAADANYCKCRELADTFSTYREYWGLSAGDGPASSPEGYAYQCYAPGGPIDGTAHVTATLASIAQQPQLVIENLLCAYHDRHRAPLGRYGFSNINVDCGWIGPDMVGIDAGAAVLALDNYLHDNRVRNVFHFLPCIQRGLERAGFRARTIRVARAA